MQITEWRYFPGPNPHCHRPILEIVVDLQELQEVPSSIHPDVCEELLAALPGLRDHYCGLGYPGGFVTRLRSGTLYGHVLEHMALELLHERGFRGSYGKTRQIGQTARYRIDFEAPEAEVGHVAAEIACAYLNERTARRPFDFAASRLRLSEAYARRCLGPSTQAIADAAQVRGIPVRRIDEGSLLELGHGRHLHRLQATLTDRCSAVSVDIAGDKQRCKRLLQAHGLPVPEGIVVAGPDDAVRAAREIGGNVVLKPLCGSQGRGVSLYLTQPRDVLSAYQIAAEKGPVLVEQQVFGRQYRLLVVGGRMVAAAERLPAMVVGDGRLSVRELWRRENEDPLRGAGHERPMTRIPLDRIAEQCLRRQGLTPESVPPAAQAVYLRDSANLSTGGSAIDCTDEVAPRLGEMAERAARVVGLDVAGVDLICSNIADPTAPAWVLEVNAAPGIRMHHFPARGIPRDVAGAIVDSLYAAPADGRIPICAITGSNGKTTTVRLVRAMLEKRGLSVGFTSTDGHGVGERYFSHSDDSGPESARAVLSDPSVDAAVLEVARGGICRGGLGYDVADVGCVLNVTGDHLGQDGIESIADLAHIKALVIEAVRPGGRAVLNADDPIAAALVHRSPVPIVFFSRFSDHLAVRRHLQAGGEAVTVTEGTITLHAAGEVTPVAGLGELRFTLDGACRPMVENALAAVACGHGLGLSPEEIRSGLLAFRGDAADNPGRLNRYDIGDVSVIVDYGHNPHALSAIAPALRAQAKSRLIGVVGMPGDRRDMDAVLLGRVAARHFDLVYCKEDQDRRGRAPGEMARLIAQGVHAMGKRPVILLDEAEAFATALSAALPGDLIAVFYEHLAPVLQEIERTHTRLRSSEPVIGSAR